MPFSEVTDYNSVMLPATSYGVRVLVWGENIHDQRDDEVRRVYPRTMHETIAAGLRRELGPGAVVSTATFQDPQHGCPPARLADTDVLLWWGHVAHDDVNDAVVDELHSAVLSGMGLIVLHSGHLSKLFRRLLGTTCTLRVREATDRELVWTVAPSHPISAGVPHPLIIQSDEMYGEFFDVPEPEKLIFLSTFSGGEVIRSGMCWTRGRGRIFYFSPGHETHPVYHHPDVQKILANAVRWCSSRRPREPLQGCIESPAGWYEPA